MSCKKPKTAYFCMEYGLDEKFKIYSGGLGILAGDILKAAKDGGYPMTGVGILWRQGYTEQFIDESGRPYDCFHEYRYDFLKDTGVNVSVNIRGRKVAAKVLECTDFVNAPLYLLDTNLPENRDFYITGQLYGWFDEERIAQEMILGIGGVKALRELGIEPDIYHFNDSHPVFAGIELIRELMDNRGMNFESALKTAKNKIVFTTHTPVKAGNETHSYKLLDYMGACRGLSRNQMKEIGGDPFSMTAAGIILSKKANAVSELHGETARNMWNNLPGGKDIISITNGVHTGTWQDSGIYKAYVESGELWQEHMRLKHGMISEIEKRCGVKLRDDVLTVGFARRAAPYKRSSLIFRDREKAAELLGNKKIQIVFSGKAHPNDIEGKKIIARIVKISREYPHNVVFIQNYDMAVGKMLTRGCDVWLNNPVRPMEASGTSGMKAAMNGVLNLSTLDGWWPEGCRDGENGWAIGNGREGTDSDAADADALYKVLIGKVIPLFYNDRDKWVGMMKSSIAMASEKFSAARMLSEYYDKLYV